MPTGFLSDAEIGRLESFPEGIEGAGLARYFGLDGDDLTFVRRQHSGARQLGIAVQLCSLRLLDHSTPSPAPPRRWWALLYGLSMLARYYPGEWTSALRLDESPEAVPLGAALDEALLAIRIHAFRARASPHRRSPRAEHDWSESRPWRSVGRSGCSVRSGSGRSPVRRLLEGLVLISRQRFSNINCLVFPTSAAA